MLSIFPSSAPLQWRESPCAQHKASQQCVVFLFSRSWWKISFRLSSTGKHTAYARGEGKAKRWSPKAGWREYGERFMCSLCPSLPVFAAAVKGASLPSIKCQAYHIDAPPSPQQSLISEQTLTLQRRANSVREAGEVRAANLLWLAERSRQSYPRSPFPSMSSSVGGEARCKKYPY